MTIHNTMKTLNLSLAVLGILAVSTMSGCISFDDDDEERTTTTRTTRSSGVLAPSTTTVERTTVIDD